MHKTTLKAAVLLVLLSVLASCAPRQAAREITREQAIEIARKHVQFEVKRTEAEQTTEENRPVWRVTFYGEPIGPSHSIGEVSFVVIDRLTGEVVSLGMS